jgi:hypothetical protein
LDDAFIEEALVSPSFPALVRQAEPMIMQLLVNCIADDGTHCMPPEDVVSLKRRWPRPASPLWCGRASP